MTKLNYFLAVSILCGITLSACSNTEQMVKEAVDKMDQENREEVLEPSSSLNLGKYRTELSDSYYSRSNQIPEAFTRIKVEQQGEDEEKDVYEGYRVQIYSGQNVANADTMAVRFREWADTTVVGYHPDTYVFFKTPYYRVHVGDFHDRERAISFSNIVKRYFRDAWVVHDRISPWKVPADTTVIYTK